MLRSLASRVRDLRGLVAAATFKEGKHGTANFASKSGVGGGRLEGKVALITGGASGLGKVTAHEFIQEGANVIIADINTELGQQTAEELGPEAHFVTCDVTIENQVAEAVDFAMAHHGKLDVMYNNAGITGPSFPPSVADLNLDEFDRVMRINVRGTMAGIKHAARAMIPRNSGSILCTASISGILGGLGPHPYAVSKFALSGIVKSVSSELCRHGIRVNCISPFVVLTPLVAKQLGAIYGNASQEWIANMVNGLGELKGATCEEIDIAHAAVYLASNEAKYVNGHNLVVDGGFTSFKQLRLPMPDHLA